MAGFYENGGDPGNQFGNNAEASATEAENWANFATDQAVPEGTGEFSSKHYSEKSSDSAAESAAEADGVAGSAAASAASASAAATSEANASVSASNASTSETNAATSESNAATSESNAAASESAASGSAVDAAASAANAQGSANFKGDWSSLTGAIVVPSSVSHDNSTWNLLNDLADVTLSEPGVTADWERLTAVIPADLHTGGGDLVASNVNIMQDGSTYDLPLANSVAAGEYLVAELPSEFSAFTPTVQRKSTDVIAWKDGTDTDMIFETEDLQSVRFTSNGVSRWSV